MENSIKIKNVDENGNEIENVDWSKWKRERVEEVFDGNNNWLRQNQPISKPHYVS